MGTLSDTNGMADAYIRNSLLSSDPTVDSSGSSGSTSGRYGNGSTTTTTMFDMWSNVTTTAATGLDKLLNGTTYVGRSDSERLIAIIVPTIFGFICVLGLFGNLLVIIVVASNKHMRNTTNILILSLAVADLLFIVICVPSTAAQYALPVWPIGNVGCKISTYAMYVCAYASVYTLVVMSLDRYLAVVHAIRSMTWRSERNTWIIIAVLWIIILLTNSPILDQYGEYTYVWKPMNETRSACINLKNLHSPTPAKIFFAFFLSFGLIIPLGVTVVLYGLMLKRLLYGVVPGGGNQSAESIRAKKRVTRMVVIIVVIFALSWLPIQVISFWDKFGSYPKTEVYVGLMMGSNCLAYMNSCVNPILYAFLSENFRRSFKKFLCCSDSSLRNMDYERTNIRFTVTEKETKSATVVSKTYTPV